MWRTRLQRLRRMDRRTLVQKIHTRIQRMGWEGHLRKRLGMTVYGNRSAYVRAPWQFALRDNPVPPPGEGYLLVEIHACGICGTDQHIADRYAPEWQPFGHEVAGVVKAVGSGVPGFQVGDRVALDTSAPCGTCETCLPPPRGRARPDLCPNPVNFWLTQTMGFGELILAPYQLAVHVPESLSLETAALVEPTGVCIDLVQTAQITPDDHVLVVGPGPLGLGALFLVKQANPARILLAGRNANSARMQAGLALGADTLIDVAQTPLAKTDFGKRKPDKILVTAPPETLPEAIQIAATGGIIAYIGVGWSESARITIDADDFHFRKLSLRPSHAWPAVHAQRSLRLLSTQPILAQTLISHRFGLEEIERAMLTVRDERQMVKKALIVRG
jgi:L-iditol 2-dehydrogenase